MSQPFSIEVLTVNPIEPCPICSGTDVFTDFYNGEKVCTGCGFVLNDVILSRREEGFASSRTESNSTDTRRHGAGARPSVYDKGLNTFIGGNRDSSGSPIKQETTADMRRLQRQDNRSKVNESTMRNLAHRPNRSSIIAERSFPFVGIATSI